MPGGRAASGDRELLVSQQVMLTNLCETTLGMSGDGSPAFPSLLAERVPDGDRVLLMRFS